MAREWLYRQPEWLIVVVFLALMALLLETGFHFATRPRKGTGDVGATIPTLQGAILALVGITMAFSFSMASARYDARRALVVQEANAIGTAYLRAGLLAGDAPGQARELLRAYVSQRLDMLGATAAPDRYARAVAESEKIHTQVWAIAERAAHDDPKPPIAGLFAQAVNDVIDVHSLRVHANEDRIPEAVLYVLIIFALVASLTVGYGAGLGGSRRPVLSVCFCLLVALMLGMVIDADRPERGLIRISQQRLVELRDAFAKPGP